MSEHADRAIPSSAYGEDDTLYSPTVPPERFTPHTDSNIRCSKCAKLLAEFATRPYQVRCPRCKTVTGAQPRMTD